MTIETDDWGAYGSSEYDSQQSSGGRGCGCWLFMLVVAAGIAIGVTFILGVWSVDSLPFVADDRGDDPMDVVVESSNSDRAILRALYDASDGDNWGNNENWLSDKPLSQWHGVTTASDGSVISLDLRSNLLSGEIPRDLSNLTKLQKPRLDDNQLSGEIPPELGQLADLERLDLSRNELTGAIPPQLGNLTSLEYLVLHDNQLGGEIPPELGKPAKLEWLILRHNQLSGQIPPELASLTELTDLMVQGNPLAGCIPSGLRLVDNNDFSELGLDFCTSASTTPTPSPEPRTTAPPLKDSTPSPVSTAIPTPRPAQARAILEALFNAAGGAGWNYSINWLTDAPFSQWYGVVTDGVRTGFSMPTG